MPRLRAAFAAMALVLALGAVTASAAADPPGGRNLVLQGVAAPAASSQRLALVIGNAAYRDAPLSNPVHDARAMAELLRSAGFTVMLHTDVDLRGLHTAVRDFGNGLRQGGVGLFYFAGHGMQIKGRNYLIPVGAEIEREDEVAYSALDAQAVLDKMESAGNGTNLMLLDACRNNPFARSFRSQAQGLAQMDAPVGTLVAFATSPGHVASDGGGRHGLYTQHLLEAMRRPGHKVEEVLKQVRAAVRRASRGQQVPWESTSLEGDLYFFDPPAVAAPQPPAPAAPPAPAGPPAAPKLDAAALDDALWQGLEDSRDAVVLNAYLKRYPTGRHAAEARRRIDALAPAAPAAVAIAAPAAAAPVAAAPGSAPAAASDRTAAAGVRPGDRWAYRRTARWGNEPPGDWSLSVASVDRDGVPSFADGAVAPDTRERWMHALLSPSGFGEQARDARGVWWARMQPGERKDLETKGPGRANDGRVYPILSQLKLKHAGVETVTVPAGTFAAVRLELEGADSYTDGNGDPQWQIWSATLWHSASLNGFIAVDIDAREPRKLNGLGWGTTAWASRTRSELLQHAPGSAGAPAEAAAGRLPPTAVAATSLQPTPAPTGAASAAAWTYRRAFRWGGAAPFDWTLPGSSAGPAGQTKAAPDGSSSTSRVVLMQHLLAPRAFGQASATPMGVWWDGLAGGDSRELRYAAQRRQASGRAVPVETQVTLRRAGTETVVVPAGSFQATRLEVTASDSFTNDRGVREVQHWYATLWFAAEAHAIAAAEFDVRVLPSSVSVGNAIASGGSWESRTRDELASRPMAESVAAR